MPRLLQVTRRSLTILAVAYCLVIVYFAIIWTLLPERFWWIVVTNLFAPLFFLPLLVLLPLCLLVRSHTLWVAVAVPTLIFGLLFGGLFVPRFKPARSIGSLRVATLNQLYYNDQADAVIAALEATHADVIGLQELSPKVAATIESQLADAYPYQWLAPADNPNGMGLISRLPFEKHTNPLGSRAQQISLVFDETAITLINVHLHFDSINRHTVIFWGDLPLPVDYDSNQSVVQTQRLIETTASISGPLIILGDFNMGDREPGYRLLEATMRDAFREAGWGFGFTFPNKKRFGPVTVPTPVVRLDYVWVRGDLAPASAEVNCNSIGADHCFVITNFHVIHGPSAAAR